MLRSKRAEPYCGIPAEHVAERLLWSLPVPTALGRDLKTVSRETAILTKSGDCHRSRRVCSYCGNVIAAAPVS